MLSHKLWYTEHWSLLHQRSLEVGGRGGGGLHQTSSFAAEPDEPVARLLCTLEREEPTLSGRECGRGGKKERVTAQARRAAKQG